MRYSETHAYSCSEYHLHDLFMVTQIINQIKRSPVKAKEADQMI